MNAELSIESVSKSSTKPGRAVERWLSLPVPAADVRSFEPVKREDIYSTHDPGYVNGVLDLSIPNGFLTYDRSVADSLCYTVGSMVAAVEHVLDHGGFACSPTSGFHHAHYSRGGGFCTFNGLVVAAQYALARGASVGILDGDAHYGDGTQELIDRLGLNIVHRSVGADFPPHDVIHDRSYIGWWWDAIEAMQGLNVVLYQAGADPHEHDPLDGHASMTTLVARDVYVFNDLPNVAWNLAGGYGPHTMNIHTSTLLSCLKASYREPSPVPSRA